MPYCRKTHGQYFEFSAGEFAAGPNYCPMCGGEWGECFE